MSILKIARMGHPVLRQKSREIRHEELGSPELERLITDMVETMHEYGGVGLAAPQVHHPQQLAIIEFAEDSSRYPGMGSQPLSIFINPRITVLDPKEQGFWEGCLSIPELRGLVHRPRKIQIDYLDRDGRARKVIAEGFFATVLQHELDHLDGRLFIDRIRDTTKLAFLDEYRKYWVPAEKSDEGELED